jgi:manganese/zinc/iron transport system substrate-binding protein
MRFGLLCAGIAGAMLSAMPLHAQAPLQVVTTIGKLADMAQALGGECVQAQSLMGPGADPHLYRPSAGDVQRLSQAQVIFYIDSALEARLAEVLEKLGAQVPTLGVLDSLPPDLIRSTDGSRDPHIWMDVGLWAQIAPPMADLLAQATPTCADTIGANLAQVQGQLVALDAWARDAIATIPAGQRVLVTAHDAFGYFSAAYGLEASEAIEGISTESEASIADIRAVADFIRARNVVAVFPETTINPRTIEALQREVLSSGGALAIGQALYSDAMGDPATPEGTYIGMIRHNVTSIVTALGGAVPDWPATLP